MASHSSLALTHGQERGMATSSRPLNADTTTAWTKQTPTVPAFAFTHPVQYPQSGAYNGSMMGHYQTRFYSSQPQNAYPAAPIYIPRHRVEPVTNGVTQVNIQPFTASPSHRNPAFYQHYQGQAHPNSRKQRGSQANKPSAAALRRLRQQIAARDDEILHLRQSLSDTRQLLTTLELDELMYLRERLSDMHHLLTHMERADTAVRRRRLSDVRHLATEMGSQRPKLPIRSRRGRLVHTEFHRYEHANHNLPVNQFGVNAGNNPGMEAVGSLGKRPSEGDHGTFRTAPATVSGQKRVKLTPTEPSTTTRATTALARFMGWGPQA